MPFFVHEGNDGPVDAGLVDVDEAVHPQGMVVKGQVIRADVNPDPAVFREVPGGPELEPTGALAGLTTTAPEVEPAREDVITHEVLPDPPAA